MGRIFKDRGDFWDWRDGVLQKERVSFGRLLYGKDVPKYYDVRSKWMYRSSPSFNRLVYGYDLIVYHKNPIHLREKPRV